VDDKAIEQAAVDSNGFPKPVRLTLLSHGAG